MFKLILSMIFTLCIPSEHIVDFNRNVEKSTSFEEILPINKSYNNLDKYKSKTAYAPDNVWYTIDFKDSYFAHGSNIIIPFDFPYLNENQLMSLWSSSENIFYTNTTIKVQYKNLEGQWIDFESYLVSTLSKDRNNMNSYEVDFYNDNNSAIRFIVQTLAPVGDRNKGRVVLDNINVYF